MHAIRSLIKGFYYLWQPKTRFYVLTPLLVNICIFASLFVYLTRSAADWAGEFLQHWASWLPDFIQTTLMWLASAGMVAVFYFAGAFLFLLLANLIAAPFCQSLANAVATERGIAINPPESSVLEILLQLPSTLWHECKKLLQFLPRILLLCLISLVLLPIPLLNLLIPLIWLIWGGWMLCYDFLGYAAEATQSPEQSVLQQMQRHRVNSMVFGGGIQLGATIPLLNLIAIPLGVCAGVLFWERYLPEIESQTL